MPLKPADPLPRWTNRDAEVSAYFHPIIVRAFVDDVVRPALAKLDADIEALGQSEAPGAPFQQADTEVLRHAALTAFCLSLQALWERQLRSYLTACAREMGDAELGLRARGHWPELVAVFPALRDGIRLEQFASFAELQLLHRIANVCRHGEGKSADALYHEHPELWPEHEDLGPLFGLSPLPPPTPNAELLALTLAQLEAFAAAVIAFWKDASFIRLASFDDKPEPVLREISESEVAFRARWNLASR